VIDVGSNSVLLLVVHVGPGGAGRVLDEALVTTRLGTGLRDGGALDRVARARTCDAVAGLASRARAAGAAEVLAFATGAVRSAVDGAAFVAEVEAASGVAVEVLSGMREAELVYHAVAGTLGAGDGPLLVADVGGRTTELTLGRGSAVEVGDSLPLGALALSETHLRGDPPGSALEAVARNVEAAFAASGLPARARAVGAVLACSGGTATALAALDLGLAAYDGCRVHGHTLSRTALRGLVARLGATPAAARAVLPGIDPGRGAILPAGAVVVERLAEAAGADAVRVSDHGVRHAYLRARLEARGIAITGFEARS
jgi:exopolyphosphatase/guanosine-5'-triphosphate,3'-diphosphate pyrophosphatase